MRSCCFIALLFCSSACVEKTKPAALDAGPKSGNRPRLRITNISFAGPAGHREDVTFGRGEQVMALISVAGFTYRDGRADLRADLRLIGPAGQTVLVERALELLRGKAPTRRPGELRGAAKLRLDPSTPPGRHKLRVTVRDLLGDREGGGEGELSIAGPAPRRSAKLAILGLRLAGDMELPAGSVIPLAFEAAGIQPERSGEEHRIELHLDSEIVDSKGTVAARRFSRPLRRALPFAPASYPLEHRLAVPRDLAVGSYVARLRLRDPRHGVASAPATVDFKVVPRRFAIFNAHLHDASGLPRDRFRFGEQAYVRLAIHGFASRDERSELEVDLAVAGARGVYLARKKAAELSGVRSASYARSGRFPLQLPLRLPALAAAGSYRLVIRARDRLAKAETKREVRFALEGAAPKPLARFRVDKLQVRRRADLPPLPGDTFVAGRAYHLTVRAGGGKLRTLRKLTYLLEIEGALRLRRVNGQLAREWKRLFRYRRTLNHQPLRVLLTADWTAPAELRSGLYDLEVELLRPKENLVSVLRKRVEIVAARPKRLTERR